MLFRHLKQKIKLHIRFLIKPAYEYIKAHHRLRTLSLAVLSKFPRSKETLLRIVRGNERSADKAQNIPTNTGSLQFLPDNLDDFSLCALEIFQIIAKEK